MSFEKWIENNPAESVHPQVLWDAAQAEERERCAGEFNELVEILRKYKTETWAVTGKNLMYSGNLVCLAANTILNKRA